LTWGNETRGGGCNISSQGRIQKGSQKTTTFRWSKQNHQTNHEIVDKQANEQQNIAKVTGEGGTCRKGIQSDHATGRRWPSKQTRRKRGDRKKRDDTGKIQRRWKKGKPIHRTQQTLSGNEGHGRHPEKRELAGKKSRAVKGECLGTTLECTDKNALTTHHLVGNEGGGEASDGVTGLIKKKTEI